jgi:predicted nucleic acid-binding protein
MSTRIFVDANVLFSAAYTEGSRVVLLFDLARASGAIVCASPFVIEEARRNLLLKRPDALGRLEALVEGVRVVPDRMALASGSSHGLPPKDVAVLAAAVAAGATMLVTGDRAHFGRLYGRVVEGLRVATVADALRFLMELGGS